MKTLSVKNPWAYLLAIGLKDVENRSRHTNFRGTVLIHASAAMHERYLPNVRGGCFTGPCASKINHAGIAPKIISNDLIYSAIIGKMDIVDCISNSKSIWAEEGQYHWIIKNAVLFDQPILSVKGKLSFWDFKIHESHNEIIECPECNKQQEAIVEHTTPFYSYVHTCEKCKYVIMESEWNKIDYDKAI